MALMGKSLQKNKEKELPKGELRLDVDGRGYFHTYTKEEIEEKYGKKKEEKGYDFNNDGKIDEKDDSIAAKHMGSIKSRKKGKKK